MAQEKERKTIYFPALLNRFQFIKQKKDLKKSTAMVVYVGLTGTVGNRNFDEGVVPRIIFQFGSFKEAVPGPEGKDVATYNWHPKIAYYVTGIFNFYNLVNGLKEIWKKVEKNKIEDEGFKLTIPKKGNFKELIIKPVKFNDGDVMFQFSYHYKVDNESRYISVYLNKQEFYNLLKYLVDFEKNYFVIVSGLLPVIVKEQERIEKWKQSSSGENYNKNSKRKSSQVKEEIEDVNEEEFEEELEDYEDEENLFDALEDELDEEI